MVRVSVSVSVASDVAIAVVWGVVLSTGLLLVATAVPIWAAPSLARRIAPYVRDVADPLGLTPMPPRRSMRSSWRAALSLRFDGDTALRQRLDRAGWAVGAGEFRVRQLTWALLGLVGGGVGSVALVVAGRGWSGGALLPPVVAVVAAVVYDARLSEAARRRGRRIREEVPTVLEFLALCLAAGESLVDALRRVGSVGAGELTAQLQSAVLAVSTGSSLSVALTDVARRVDVPSVTRAVDHLIAAIDRGAPLAQVLQAQAQDAREDAKRGLIEQAGRKEILMLLPLVFLVLPLSVLFAMFPGVVMLRLGL